MFTVYVVVCMMYFTNIHIQAVNCRNFPYNGEFDTLSFCRRSEDYIARYREKAWGDSAWLEWYERGKVFSLRTSSAMSVCWRTNRQQAHYNVPTAQP